MALWLLNLIAAVSTRNLVFRSNAASMQDKAQLVASSLAGLDELTQEQRVLLGLLSRHSR